jgi:hypothetical protein
MDSKLVEAVRDRLIVTFCYDGIKRTVEAHAYGVHQETQDEILIGFQRGGSRQWGDLAGWKVYRLSAIIDFRSTGIQFKLNRKSTKAYPPRHFSQLFAKAEKSAGISSAA